MGAAQAENGLRASRGRLRRRRCRCWWYAGQGLRMASCRGWLRLDLCLALPRRRGGSHHISVRSGCVKETAILSNFTCFPETVVGVRESMVDWIARVLSDEAVDSRRREARMEQERRLWKGTLRDIHSLIHSFIDGLAAADWS